jgi:Tol biopolymer transport system component
MRADGSQQHRIARTPQYPGRLAIAWSPDRRKILFERPRTATDLRHAIVVVGRDGSGLRTLTNGIDDATSPAWSPDGSKIAYGGSSGIFVMDAKGAHKPSL